VQVSSSEIETDRKKKKRTILETWPHIPSGLLSFHTSDTPTQRRSRWEAHGWWEHASALGSSQKYHRHPVKEQSTCQPHFHVCLSAALRTLLSFILSEMGNLGVRTGP